MERVVYLAISGAPHKGSASNVRYFSGRVYHRSPQCPALREHIIPTIESSAAAAGMVVCLRCE